MDPSALTPASTTMKVENVAPSCFDQIYNLNIDLGQSVAFDQMNGVVVLAEGSTCWNELRDAYFAFKRFVEEQLALAANENIKAVAETTGASMLDEKKVDEAVDSLTNDVSTEVEEATGITKILEEIDKYTSMQLMVSMYSWNESDVQPGESVGICISPENKPGYKSSCWSWTLSDEGSYGADAKSYLIDLSTFNAEAKLEDQPSIGDTLGGEGMVPLMFGNWICAAPMEFMGKMRTTCGRLIPKNDTPEDPRFDLNQEVQVSTYYTSRFTGRVPPAEKVNDNPALLGQSNLGFQAYTLNVMDALGIAQDGAVSTAATSLVGFVAAIAALSF